MTTPVTSPDPLANLKDIHLPAEVGMWPLAPGWWVLLGLILALFITAVLLWRNSRKRSHYRRAANAELQLLQQTENPSLQLEQSNRLLKRVAIVAYPKLSVAALNGNSWVNFLQHSAPSANAPEHLHRLLGEQLYGPGTVAEEDVKELTNFAHQWINRHLPESKLAALESASC